MTQNLFCTVDRACGEEEEEEEEEEEVVGFVGGR
jgi:hypothetical protein